MAKSVVKLTRPRGRNIVGWSPTSTNNERSGVKPIPSYAAVICTLGRREAILLTTSKRGGLHARYARVQHWYFICEAANEVRINLFKYCNLIRLQIFCSVEQNWV